MTPLPHVYSIEVGTTGNTYATLASRGLPSVRVASPPAYDGPGDAWSPEHLLLASVASCFVMTFRAVARASRLPFDGLVVDANGTVDRDAGTVRFTTITLHVRISVPAGTNHERCEQIVSKTESHCLVSASLATPVRVVTDVAVAQAADERPQVLQ